MNRITQNDKILHWFETHDVITPLDAMQAYRIMRLAARINELEHAGYRFKHEMVEFKSRHGRTGHYMRYSRCE